MPKVLIDGVVDPPGLERLQAMPGMQVEIAPGNYAECRELPAALLHDVEFMLCTFPPKNLADMPRLKFLQISSAGYQQLVGLGLHDQGIRACNGLGEFDVPIAEWTIAMLVNLSRDLRGMIRNQEQGKWERLPQYEVEIRGRTLGIWGYGGIGRETARIAKAMGLRIHVMTRTGQRTRNHAYLVPGTGDPAGELPDKLFTLDQKEEFLSQLDFLLLSMPLTEENRGIVGAKELRTLPAHAYVLNPARGPLIDEAALLAALREGWIAGAALDTHYYYPMPSDHPLWSLPNVIMTPHISGSGASTHFASRAWDIFVQNVARFLEGRALLNELRAEQLAG